MRAERGVHGGERSGRGRGGGGEGGARAGGGWLGCVEAGEGACGRGVRGSGAWGGEWRLYARHCLRLYARPRCSIQHLCACAGVLVCVFYVCVCLCVCMRVRMLWEHMCQNGILVSLSVRVDSFSRAPGFERRRANSRGEVDVPGGLSRGWANGNPLVLRTVVSTFYRIPVYRP